MRCRITLFRPDLLNTFDQIVSKNLEPLPDRWGYLYFTSYSSSTLSAISINEDAGVSDTQGALIIPPARQAWRQKKRVGFELRSGNS
jgi:hypothetical protein